MVRERSKHLPQAEPGPAGAAEARLAVLDRDPQGGARVNNVAIVWALAQTGQHADTGIRNDNLEGGSRRGKSHQAGLRPAAMPEDIVLQFAHGAYDGCGKRLCEPNRDSRLFSSASPERPLIRSIASLCKAGQRERTLAGSIAAALDQTTIERVFDYGHERRGEADMCEQGGVAAARHQHFDERTEPAGSFDVDLSKCRQIARLSGPQKIISAGEVTVQLMILSLRYSHPADPRPAFWQRSGWTMNWPALSQPPPDDSSLADLPKTCRH